MPRSQSVAAASPAGESEWEVFCRLLTHDDRNSYYVVSSDASGSWEETAVKSESLPALGFNSSAAYYMTHNGFTAPRRTSDQVRQLNALFFDLDCHNLGPNETRCAVRAAIAKLQEAVFNGQLPVPTMIIDSGRGLQLFYVLQRSVPYRSSADGEPNVKAIGLFNHVQKRLAELLDAVMGAVAGISVDRATFDASRVSRIPGTFNAKAGRFAKLLDYSETALHNLSELSRFCAQSSLLVRKSPDRTKRFKRSGTVLQFQPLMMSRLSKIMELQEHRGYDCAGNRELMSFVFYNTAVQIYTHEDAGFRLRMFNARFKNPLAQCELDGIVKSVDSVTNMHGDQGYYLIGAKRLTELLSLTQDEASAIDFFQSRRTVERAMAKQQTKRKRQLRDNRIIELHNAGTTYASIAQLVECSVRTVASVVAAEREANKKRANLRNNVCTKSYNKNVISTCNFLSYESKECWAIPISSNSFWGFGTASVSFSMTKTLPSSVSVTLQEGFLLLLLSYLYLSYCRLVQ